METKTPSRDSKLSRCVHECKEIARNVTVEPLIFLYNVPNIVTSITAFNLFLSKACLSKYGHSDGICSALDQRNTSGLKNKDTEIVNSVMTISQWTQCLKSGLPLLIIIFLGSWSDRSGRRKPCILLPFVGQLMSNLTLLVCTFFLLETSMELTSLAAAFWMGISGNWYVMYMGAYSYLGDVAQKNHTVRVSLATITILVSVIVGQAISGPLFHYFGFYGVFFTSTLASLVALSYGTFFLKELPRPLLPTPKDPQSGDSLWQSLGTFFSLQRVIQTFRVFFNKAGSNRRVKLVMLAIISMVLSGHDNVENDVVYLFARHSFNWDQTKFCIFKTFGETMHMIGCAVIAGIFKHLYIIDDAIIGIIGSSGKIAGSMVYACAVTDWQLYLASFAEITQGASMIAFLGIVTKVVPPEELARVHSVFGLLQTLAPVVYNAIYSNVFNATKNTWPGALFFVGGMMTVTALIGFIWLYIVRDVDVAGEGESRAQDAVELEQ